MIRLPQRRAGSCLPAGRSLHQIIQAVLIHPVILWGIGEAVGILSSQLRSLCPPCSGASTAS